MATKFKFIMPTPLNVLSEAHANIVTNLRKSRSADVQLPSLYRLAYAVVNNTGELLVYDTDSEEQ